MISFKRHIFEASIDEILPRNIRSAITRGGGKIYQIGGAVRDELIGEVSKDLDLLVTGVELSDLEKRLTPFGKVDVVGKSFGILKFKGEGTDEYIDISVPRVDSKSTGKGHKEFEIKLGKGISLEQDQLRRDFWMNAIAKDIETGELTDVGGQGKLDIENKQVRMINPKAFQEDPLRMLRAIQFAARFGFKIEPKTLKEIERNSKLVTTVAPERIQEELRKMFEKGKVPSRGVSYMWSTGILKHLFPKAPRGIDTKTINKLDKSAFPAFIAILLYNYGSEAGSVAKTGLNLSNSDTKAVDAVIKFDDKGIRMDDFSLIQFTAKKPQNIMDNLDAYAIASGDKKFAPSTRLANIKRQGKPINLKQLKVGGRDLTSIGLKGKNVGNALQYLLRYAVKTGRTAKVDLIKKAKQRYQIREMLSFIQYITEADTVGHTLWIDPKGKIYDMGSIEGNTHFNWMYKNWKKHMKSPIPDRTNKKDVRRVYDEPFEKGWVRVRNFYNSLDVEGTPQALRRNRSVGKTVMGLVDDGMVRPDKPFVYFDVWEKDKTDRKKDKMFRLPDEYDDAKKYAA